MSRSKKFKNMIGAFTFLVTVSSSCNAQIAAWNFSGILSGSPPVTYAATTVSSNIDTSGFNTLTRGSTALASGANNSFRTTGFMNNGISTANTDYFQFVVSPSAGYTFSLSSIDSNFAGTSSYAATPGVTMQWAYSTDGTNFNLIGSSFTLIGTPSTSPTVDLTSVSALQNVDANTSITMRFFASGQTATGGWGFISSTSVDGLSLGGSVSAIPEPSTYAAIFGALALVGTVWHRRRQRIAT